MGGSLENSNRNKSGVSPVAADLRAAVLPGDPACPCPEVTGHLFSSSCVDGPAVMRGF